MDGKPKLCKVASPHGTVDVSVPAEYVNDALAILPFDWKMVTSGGGCDNTMHPREGTITNMTYRMPCFSTDLKNIVLRSFQKDSITLCIDCNVSAATMVEAQPQIIFGTTATSGRISTCVTSSSPDMPDTQVIMDAMARQVKVWEPFIRGHSVVEFKRFSVYDHHEHLTLVFPETGDAVTDQKIRRKVHDIFGWPRKPMLIAAGSNNPTAARGISLLRTPHRSVVNKTPLEGGQEYFVAGTYDYWHYKCDGYDDSGWGCAYRSCQTLLSWFQHRGCLPTIPTLREIQQILKEVDPAAQKKPNFVGSKEWIGSYEVMMVLQRFLPSVECQLKSVEKGSDLGEDPTVMRTLQSHFKNVGSPVMIGGHNYAHTIIGIDYNPSLGKIQYLILDPHYPSQKPDMGTAIEKGWCGWKPPSFFNASQFYNLCLPKLPTDI